MGEGIVLKYKNIAEIINILREKTVIEDAAEKLAKYNQQFAGVDFSSDRPLGEFTEDDAKQFVKDIAKEATLDPNDDENLEYIRENLFPHFVYNDGDFSVGPDGVFKITSVSFPEDLENVDLLFPSQGADKFFVNHQLEVFENPKYIKNADFLALTLGEAKKDEFNFVTEEMARYIYKVVIGEIEETTLLDPDTGEIQDFALAGIDENKVLNWLQAWDDKLFVLKEYLRNGKLLDERGEYTLEVPNFKSGDYESSMTALFQFEIDNPSRILTGDSLISQYDNTFTDRKEDNFKTSVINGAYGIQMIP